MSLRMKWVIAFAIGVALLWIGWFVPFFLSAFQVLLCIVLVLIIMMQSGSAADLAGAFGGAGSQTAFGPRSAATFLTKATIWCSTMFMLSSLLIGLHSPTGVAGANSVLSRASAPPTGQSAPPPVRTQPQTPAPVHLPPAKPAPAIPAGQSPKH